MNKIIISLILFFPLLALSAENGQVLVGSEFPPFRIVSGDDKVLTQDMIKGKTIIFFYETPDSYEINQPFKNDLNKLYDIQDKKTKDSLFKLAVIDCTSAFWPFTAIWKSRLVSQSEKRYFTIYGDWDGKMLNDFKLADNDSNLMLIDKKGIIRYYTHGKIEVEQGEKIKNLMLELLAGK